MASSARERLRNASRRLTAGQGNSAPAAKKSLGQHFLTNPGICRRIVDLIAPSGSPERLASLIKLCFQQRRKQMGGLFRRAGRGDLLDGLAALGISPEKRPEELSVSDFLALSEQSVKSVTPLL